MQRGCRRSVCKALCMLLLSSEQLMQALRLPQACTSETIPLWPGRYAVAVTRSTLNREGSPCAAGVD